MSTTELFENFITNGKINLLDGSKVSISTFEKLFNGCELNYNDLCDRDAGEMGYKPFFDSLKEKGILN